MEAVTDPEKAARARLAKAGKRTAARKRKIQEYRAGKGSSQSTKKRAREEGVRAGVNSFHGSVHNKDLKKDYAHTALLSYLRGMIHNARSLMIARVASAPGP